jgi:CRISP-associated protein Cas1
MLKRSILLENKTSVHTKNLQLVVKTEVVEKSIPIEDLGFVVIDHPEVYLSMPALNLLVEHQVAVIFCNQNHLPNGMLLNLNSHHIQQEIFKNQIEASVPLKKQLWQQTVVEKIQNQGKPLLQIKLEVKKTEKFYKTLNQNPNNRLNAFKCSLNLLIYVFISLSHLFR